MIKAQNPDINDDVRIAYSIGAIEKIRSFVDSGDTLTLGIGAHDRWACGKAISSTKWWRSELIDKRTDYKSAYTFTVL